MRLEGKVAIVSGGGTGIGAAAARRFAREGAKVVVTGRRAEPLEEVAAETGCRVVAGDTADDDHVREAVAAAVGAFGGLDIVVANAGLGFGGAAVDVDNERWDRTLDVNVTGAFRLVRAAIPALIERGGGSIVLISSVNAFVSGTESAAYGTSKAAMNGLARSIAVDYGPRGVRANALCPGWVVTPMGDRAMQELMKERGISLEEAYDLVTRYTPLRRPATADEIATCCLFLASDESSIVTGTALVADGGGLVMDVTEVAYQQERP
jgi:meso-butanediol dehydrogenase / (S,S)-butanediol dehydrogenase / diacetyl reductase